MRFFAFYMANFLKITGFWKIKLKKSGMGLLLKPGRGLQAALEPFKKFCSHAVGGLWRAVFLSFGVVSAQSQGCLEPAPSPKPSQNSKILAPHGHNIS